MTAGGTNGVLLLLPFFFTTIAAAGALSVFVEGEAVWAGVPPGHTVAWIRNTAYAETGIAKDSDRDGRIYLSQDTSIKRWLLIDVGTGEWHTTDLRPSKALAPGSIVPGPGGAYTYAFIPGSWGYAAKPLWVRPGVGARALPNVGQFRVSLLINGDTVDERNETIELTASHDSVVIAATLLEIVDDESSRRRVTRR